MKRLIAVLGALALALTLGATAPAGAAPEQPAALAGARAAASAGLSAEALQAPRAPAMPSVTVTCYNRHRFDDDHRNDGSPGADEWWITGVVYYRYCHVSGPGRDYVIVKFADGRYNFEGRHMDCDFRMPHALKWVKFNLYAWDYEGHNFNPPAFYVPCDPSTHHRVRKYYLDNWIHLHWHDGRAPRWKFNYEIKRTGYFGDVSIYGTVSGLFRPCSGKGDRPC